MPQASNKRSARRVSRLVCGTSFTECGNDPRAASHIN
jgi:hypothetical protein